MKKSGSLFCPDRPAGDGEKGKPLSDEGGNHSIMLSVFSVKLPPKEASEHKEGDLYKAVDIHGKRFTLYYGYYEECDRVNPLVPPVPIYPDFSRDPQYTDEGFALVTMMQDACRHFDGKLQKDSGCCDCSHFRKCEEFFGICACSENKHKGNSP